MRKSLIATLESGGTKMVAALSSGPNDIRIRKRIPTTTPEETLRSLIQFFQHATAEYGQASALAIGTFGPADLDPASSSYGFITKTPKEGWSQTDLLGPLQKALNVPAIFETDVAASLFGEATWGAAAELRNAAYLTIGTGIGGSLMIDRKIVHGIGHSEMGHMNVRPHPKDSFTGCCPFHGNCLEGMASGSAISKRWEIPAEELPAEHPAWEIQADYLAQSCMNLLMIAPPQRIILGGGVMHQEQLFSLIRARLKTMLNQYLSYPEVADDLENYIVPPRLGDDSALLGCVALGHELLTHPKAV